MSILDIFKRKTDTNEESNDVSARVNYQKAYDNLLMYVNGDKTAVKMSTIQYILSLDQEMIEDVIYTPSAYWHQRNIIIGVVLKNDTTPIMLVDIMDITRHSWAAYEDIGNIDSFTKLIKRTYIGDLVLISHSQRIGEIEPSMIKSFKQIINVKHGLAHNPPLK